jgi:hypothetical protein
MSALEFILTLLVLGVLYQLHQVRRDIARMCCHVSGHGVATFEKWGNVGYCPLCKEQIATRPPESAEDYLGMQSGPDTLYQRTERIAAKLGVED